MEKPKRIRTPRRNYFDVGVFLENPEEELDAAVKLYREAKVAFGKVLNARPGSEQERYRKIYQETVRGLAADFKCDLDFSTEITPGIFKLDDSGTLSIDLVAIEDSRRITRRVQEKFPYDDDYGYFSDCLDKLDRLEFAVANFTYRERLPKTSQYLKVINDFTRTVESLKAVNC